MAGVHDYDFHNGSTGILGVLKEPRSEDSSESDDEAKESDIQEKDQPSTVSVDAALATSPQTIQPARLSCSILVTLADLSG
jgi:hypothetical protein